MNKIIIGSRGSDLALWQAHYVQNQLIALGFQSEIKIITTKGDTIQHLSFDKIEGKGFFTKELEEALLNSEIDLAVHSLKDLPTENPEGLTIAALSYREDPSEMLLIRKEIYHAELPLNLPLNAKVGTSSARRKTQLLAIRPDLEIVQLRGNVPTRVKKIQNAQYDAILLAAAGIRRLQLPTDGLIVNTIAPTRFIPAPGQGVLGLQIRANDTLSNNIIFKLNNAKVAELVSIERKILNAFDGGCHMPVGVYAHNTLNGNWLQVCKANDEHTLPVYYTQKFSETADLNITSIVNTCNHPTKCSIWFSKEKNDWPFLTHVLENHGFTVNGQSGIYFENLQPNKHQEQFDAALFGSPRAVESYLKAGNVLPKIIITTGIATSNAILKLGRKPDFEAPATDLLAVDWQKAFELVAGKKVILPISESSLKTLEQLFATKCLLTVEVAYKTLLKQDLELPKADKYLFTSPSNVAAFLTQNKLPDQCEIIAIGPKTEEALKRHGLNATVTSFSADQAVLLGLLMRNYAA